MDAILFFGQFFGYGGHGCDIFAGKDAMHEYHHWTGVGGGIEIVG